MGRPATFEREEVLHKAMDAFWEHGYSGIGVADLGRVMRLKPGSLYAAFNSKEDLFLAVLELYGRQSLDRIEAALAAADSPLAGIRRYFRQLADEIASGRAGRGCLLVNTVLELGRRGGVVQEHVNGHLGRIEKLFRNALLEARKRGELPAGKDPKALAAFLMSGIWGLRVLSGTSPGQKRARDIVAQLLTVLD
jgi:TetR/AcrR family transcriptional repressor of nem operon